MCAWLCMTCRSHNWICEALTQFSFLTNGSLRVYYNWDHTHPSHLPWTPENQSHLLPTTQLHAFFFCRSMYFHLTSMSVFLHGCTSCVPGVCGPQRKVRHLETEITGACELSQWCWELTSGWCGLYLPWPHPWERLLGPEGVTCQSLLGWVRCGESWAPIPSRTKRWGLSPPPV